MAYFTVKLQLNVYNVQKMFKEYDREDQFSYEGIEAILEYLEETSSEKDQSFELDIISLCCDFVEMSKDEVINEYDLFDENEKIEDDEKHDYIIERLNNHTWARELSNGNILFIAF